MLFYLRQEQQGIDKIFESYRQHGGKLIRYRWVWSVILFTSMQSIVVHVPLNQSKFKAGLKYTGKSMLLGFWGLPVGTVFSLVAIIINCCGGEDVTEELTTPSSLDGKRISPKKTDKAILIALGILIVLIALGIFLMLKYLKV
jgi:hypothetical protein